MLTESEVIAQGTETEPKLSENTYIASEVIANAKESPDFLAGLAMPDVFEYMWPVVFLSIWARLRELIDRPRDFSKFAIGLPRGFGKTTLIKLFILYIIIFTKRQFILILSANAGLAENIISDVMDMLDEPNIKALFGDWRLGVEKDTNALKKFGFRGRNIIIAGLGSGGSVRGLNLKNARPDVIVFEDTQTREVADSQTVSEDLYKWMLGTAMKAKSPKGCLTVFIANMYPTPYSILKKLKANPEWIKYIAGGITVGADGTMQSLWEELQPLSQLLGEYQADLQAGHPEIFHAEVLNDENASVNSAIDISKIHTFQEDEEEIHAGNFIVIDPATGKLNKDAVSIGYFQVHDAVPVCWEIEAGAFSPKECIRIAIKLCLKYNCRLVVIEGVAYQSTLGFWFTYICEQMGITGIQCVDIYPGKKSKTARILEMFKQLMGGEIVLHPRTWSQCLSELLGFNPLKMDNVDGILDLLTYSPIVIAKYRQFLLSGTIIEMQQETGVTEIDYSDAHNSAF